MGITTLPSRIGLIRPCLQSLLDGDRLPDRIAMTLPDGPLLRGDSGYAVPDFVTDRAWHNGIVEIARPPHDCGPGSKLLGALATIAEPSVLILADDDVTYRRWYDQVHEVGALRYLDGDLERTTLTRDGLDHLIATAEMPPVRRARMLAGCHVDHFVGRSARRVTRRLRRLVGRD